MLNLFTIMSSKQFSHPLKVKSFHYLSLFPVVIFLVIFFFIFGSIEAVSILTSHKTDYICSNIIIMLSLFRWNTMLVSKNQTPPFKMLILIFRLFCSILDVSFLWISSPKLSQEEVDLFNQMVHKWCIIVKQ